MNRLILLSLIIFSTAITFAKGPVKISGLVTDQNNEPLEFVTVKVQGKPLGTTSGLDGRYTLSCPEPTLSGLYFRASVSRNPSANLSTPRAK